MEAGAEAMVVETLGEPSLLRKGDCSVVTGATVRMISCMLLLCNEHKNSQTSHSRSSLCHSCCAHSSSRHSG